MRISILSIGRIEPDILNRISEGLAKIYRCGVELGREVPIPNGAYNPGRMQYSSLKMLDALKPLKTGKSGLVLAVTDVDLYVPGLNFVFGEADILSGIVIISLTRLRQEFYGLKVDRTLFYKRALKEAVHELGHACGLDHCDDPGCIMYFSNSIADTDGKGPGFCRDCNERLGL